MYNIDYNYTDSNGNIGVTQTRIIHIVDTTMPVLSVNGSGIVTIEVFDAYNES